ncbi:ISL3 family transposase [Hamadaea sp. NPDC051192]|uniref:ISL3 family transposase n=1 Tax=Hamadaea sp. NPDC051192 TaxID=3154940 RepID=UPI0034175D83
MDGATTRLLGPEGLAVTSVEDGQVGPVVHLVPTDEAARRCPECGTRARRSKGRRSTRPRDLPTGGRRPSLVWRKRRWRCDQSSCPRRSFTEAVGSVSARKRLTVGLRASAGAAVADTGRTVVQSAREHDVSSSVVAAAFTEHAARVLPVQPETVEVLGIDEVRRGRPKWVYDDQAQSWQTIVDRWHIGFVDLSGGQGLLGQVEGRTAAAVVERLAARPADWRQRIRHVAIGMSTVFKSAIRQALPHAQLVVDHFPVAQLANATVTEVRRWVTIQVRGRRGRKGNHEWELRNRLTRRADSLSNDHLAELQADLKLLPKRIGTPITAAWNTKEDLLDLLALAHTNPNREQIADLLYRFYCGCAASGLPELERLATTVQTWWLTILAFINTGITNAGSEGTNRMIKTIARDAYAFRNPVNQRLRTRCATTRRARGHLDPR